MNELGLRAHHWGVSVPDLDASIAWYQQMLGFVLERKAEIPGQDTRYAMLRLDEIRVEIFHSEGSKPLPFGRREPNMDFRTQGNLHFSFVAPNVRELAEALRARGVDIVWIKEFAFGANVFIRDNSGNLIEIVQERFDC